MKGYKSFADLYKGIKENELKSLIEKDDKGRRDYLLEHGIDINLGYYGKYQKETKTVTLNLKNPLTDQEPIKVKLIRDYSIPADVQRVKVFLYINERACEDNDPDNVFFCDIEQRLKERIEAIESARQEMIDASRRKQEREQRKKLLAQEEKKKILGIIKSRGITTLVHVTPIENLSSILEKGIVPRNDVPHGATVLDEQRSDGRTDCTCLSVEKPNYKYIRSKKYENVDVRFVCLCIDPAILLDDNNKYYCHHNAATHSITEALSRDKLTSSSDFQHMFDNTVVAYGSTTGIKKTDRKKDMPANWTTDIQAEILYQGVISPEHIKSIEFQSIEDAKKAMHILKKQGLYYTINERFRL